MKTLKHIIEGLFDVENIADEVGEDLGFDAHWKRVKQNVVTTIEGDTIVFDFSGHVGYNKVDLSIFDQINCKSVGYKKIIIRDNKSSRNLKTEILAGNLTLDGKRNFVEELHLDIKGMPEFTDRFASQIQNVKIYSDWVGDRERTNLLPEYYKGCEFFCKTAFVDFAGDEKLEFDINCDNLYIIHDADRADWPELTNMELVKIKDKSYKEKVEKMWDLRMFPKEKFFINFPGRTGAQVFNEFIKNHFSKLKYEKIKIDYCKIRGYGDYWHEYIDCNGRTWTCVYYGRW